MPKIRVHCPTCNKRFRVRRKDVAAGMRCSCGTLVEQHSPWQEFLGFGLGGVFCGILSGLCILFACFDFTIWWWLLPGMAVVGFLAGGLFGESGLEAMSAFWSRRRD